MSESDVRRGKPPKHAQFKKGTSGNPRGRPRRKANELSKIINDVANEPVEYRVGGRLRKGTRHELNLKSLVQQALAGDVKAAETLLKVREDAQQGELGIEKIQLTNWLPDYPGQTSEQKTAEHANQGSIPPSGQRDPSDDEPSK
jgi:Family of unknown function (DUF5681)